MIILEFYELHLGKKVVKLDLTLHSWLVSEKIKLKPCNMHIVYILWLYFF